MRLVLATYNVHRCIGTDGRHLPDRTAEVIRELDADIIGLQEVDSGFHIENGIDQIDYLARATGLEPIAAPTLRRHAAEYGNALLTRHDVHAMERIDLSVPRREPRGALEVDFEAHGHLLRVIVTHFGLRRWERVEQANRIYARLAGCEGRPIVILGDFNEWLWGDPSMRPFHARFGRSRLRTFPSRRPLFAIDRVLVEPQSLLVQTRVHTSALARVASDHLPLRAELDLPSIEGQAVTSIHGVRGKRGKASATIEATPADLEVESFDALVIPGGYSPDHLRTDQPLVSLIRRFCQSGRLVAAVCHGPQLLIEADVVDGRTLTSWPSVRTDLENAGAVWVDREVVEDDNLITSRKPEELDAFTRAILRRLGSSSEKRRSAAH